ncbi:imidazolonepropionase [Flammeovirgaceae bacterium SG7u.111]|nr:imidazolonepropionase [Flammeovirgaceae bacterium SG7u.132]WPO36971.1 imidazolonepropionase [Flammeovirgaceae bacterium SG7u.111]
MKKLIGPFRQVLTMRHLPLHGKLADAQLEIIASAGILVEGEMIEQIGNFQTLQSSLKEGEYEQVEVPKEAVALPGLIDAHTHLCWAGSRADDYARRNGGMSYLEIAEKGGGIWSTVKKTRSASQEELVKLMLKREWEHLSQGITTIEVKSGYGLSVAEELKQLRAIKTATKHCKADLIPTCLSAHIKPKDFEGTHSEYLDTISKEVFPLLKAEGLAQRIDAFVEQGAFSSEDIAPYFELAKAEGFDLVVHADQFHVGGTEVAAKFGAKSADHLEASTDKEIEILVKSGVAAVALPGASMGLGCAFTPARKILDAGGILAIASDWNPGSAPMGDLMMQAAVLGAYEKLSNAEVLAALTYRAAHVLSLEDRGKLEQGFLADFVIYETADFQEILYQQGRMRPAQVWKMGELVMC